MNQNRSITWTRHQVRRGFSIVDLMVSMAVMVLLVAILLPSLGSATELARRAKCASNVRQLGLGLQMYAYDHGDLIPPSMFRSFSGAHDQSTAQDTIYVRLDSRDFNGTERQPVGVQWDGLGHLAVLSYADAPNVYYCPSHTGNHPYSRYASTWEQREGTIADNYQFRIPDAGTRLGNLKNWTTLIADGMRTLPDYNHKVGNNMLKADLSVQWFADTGGELANLLATDEEMASRAGQQVTRAWEALDNSSSNNQQTTTSSSQGNRVGG